MRIGGRGRGRDSGRDSRCGCGGVVPCRTRHQGRKITGAVKGVHALFPGLHDTLGVQRPGSGDTSGSGCGRGCGGSGGSGGSGGGGSVDT